MTPSVRPNSRAERGGQMMLLHADDRHGRGALERLAFQRLGYVGVSSDEQVQAIVARALADPPPESHPHSWEECGMCLDCDAAWVLARRAEEGSEVVP